MFINCIILGLAPALGNVYQRAHRFLVSAHLVGLVNESAVFDTAEATWSTIFVQCNDVHP